MESPLWCDQCSCCPCVVHSAGAADCRIMGNTRVQPHCGSGLYELGKRIFDKYGRIRPGCSVSGCKRKCTGILPIVEICRPGEAPDGEEVKKLTDKSIVLRYLGKTEKQWLKVEYAEENQAVRGWLHESAVSRWRPRKNSFEYIKPGSSLRLSASGVPIFTCKFIGFEKAGDGTIHIILKQ